MGLYEQYFEQYAEGFSFEPSRHITAQLFDIEIEIDVFEYNSPYAHREWAQVSLKKGDLTYNCRFCDRHVYQHGFYPVRIDGQQMILFSKTLYGFVLLNVDTLVVEYEYFPKHVLASGEDFEESFIVCSVKQLDHIMFFSGCYWACPSGYFAFDYDKKLFLDLSKQYDVFPADEVVIQDDTIVIRCTDKNLPPKEAVVFKQDLINDIIQYGTAEF